MHVTCLDREEKGNEHKARIEKILDMPVKYIFYSFISSAYP